MRIANELGVRRMLLTMSDPQWYQIAVADGKLYGLRESRLEPDDMVYIGSNGYTDYTQYPRWVALLVNPTRELFHLQKSYFSKKRICITYERGGREIQAYLDQEGSCIHYNPQTLAKYLELDMDFFYLQTSVDLQIPEIDSYSGPTMYLPRSYPVHMQGVNTYQSNGQLVDVAGPGTYFSRRGRIHDFARLHNMKVVQMGFSGEMAVSASSLFPVPLASQGKGPFCYDRLNEPRRWHGQSKYRGSQNIYAWEPYGTQGTRCGPGSYVQVAAEITLFTLEFDSDRVSPQSHLFLDYDHMKEMIPFLMQGENLWQLSYVRNDMLNVPSNSMIYRQLYYEVLAKGKVAPVVDRFSIYAYFNKYTDIWFMDDKWLGHLNLTYNVFPFKDLKPYRKTIFLIGPVSEVKTMSTDIIAILACNGFNVSQTTTEGETSHWIIDNQFTTSDRVQYIEYVQNEWPVICWGNGNETTDPL